MMVKGDSPSLSVSRRSNQLFGLVGGDEVHQFGRRVSIDNGLVYLARE